MRSPAFFSQALGFPLVSPAYTTFPLKLGSFLESLLRHCERRKRPQRGAPLGLQRIVNPTCAEGITLAQSPESAQNLGSHPRSHNAILRFQADSTMAPENVMLPDRTRIPQCLADLNTGDSAAWQRLIPLVYDTLRLRAAP